MLQAVLHHKLREEIRAQMYAGTTLDAPEDLLTSTVFGPLRYLPTVDVWRLCGEIFPRSADTTIEDPFRPIGHDLCFWPSLDPSDWWRALGHERVEPDVVLVFTDSGQRKHVYLIEVKWGAPLSDRQLRAQLDAAKEKWGLHITQVLLTRDSVLDASVTQQIADTGSSNVTWRDFRDRVSPAQSTPEQIRRWAADVAGFLVELGVVTFTGFAGYARHLDPRAVTRWFVRQFGFQIVRQVSEQQLRQIRSWRIQND